MPGKDFKQFGKSTKPFWVILIVLSAAALYFLYGGGKQVPVVDLGEQLPDVGAVKKERTPFVKLTENQYKRILRRNEVHFDEGNFDNLGNVAVRLGQFYEGDRPQIEIEVKAIDFPTYGLVSLDLELDLAMGFTKGKRYNLYDRKAAEKNPKFKRIYFEKDKTKPGRIFLKGSKKISLLEGAKKEVFKGVKGKAVLNMPVGISVLEFGPEKVNSVLSAPSGAKARFNSVENGNVSVTYTGDAQNYVGTFAYNELGQELLPLNLNLPKKDGKALLNNAYGGKVHTIRVVIADSIYKKEFPFLLKQ